MRRRSAVLIAVLAGGLVPLASSTSPAKAQPCEGVCPEPYVRATLCTASHAKDYKNLPKHAGDCFTQLH